MLTKIYEQSPSEKELRRVVSMLERDGLIIYPTDSVYAFGCSLRSAKGVERLRRICGKQESDLSVVFPALAQVAEYCRVDNAAFRVLRANLPGAFTFILPASSRVPDKALERRKTIGVRIPANAIALAIVEMLGCPVMTASVHGNDLGVEYLTDPELLDECYGHEVDMVVDGGIGDCIPTTIVDLTSDEPEVIREGRGVLN